MITLKTDEVAERLHMLDKAEGWSAERRPKWKVSSGVCQPLCSLAEDPGMDE